MHKEGLGPKINNNPPDYRTGDEQLKYFGADLNKYVRKHCKDEMSYINLDGCQFCYESKFFRVIEYKHMSEALPQSQYDSLKFLSIIGKKAGPVVYNTWAPKKLKCFVVRADFIEGKNDTIRNDLAIIIDIGSDKQYKVNQNQLNAFLNFEDTSDWVSEPWEYKCPPKRIKS